MLCIYGAYGTLCLRVRWVLETEGKSIFLFVLQLEFHLSACCLFLSRFLLIFSLFFFSSLLSTCNKQGNVVIKRTRFPATLLLSELKKNPRKGEKNQFKIKTFCCCIQSDMYTECSYKTCHFVSLYSACLLANLWLLLTTNKIVFHVSGKSSIVTNDYYLEICHTTCGILLCPHWKRGQVSQTLHYNDHIVMVNVALLSHT